jgi:hypothetical protein
MPGRAILDQWPAAGYLHLMLHQFNIIIGLVSVLRGAHVLSGARLVCYNEVVYGQLLEACSGVAVWLLSTGGFGLDALLRQRTSEDDVISYGGTLVSTTGLHIMGCMNRA